MELPITADVDPCVFIGLYAVNRAVLTTTRVDIAYLLMLAIRVNAIEVSSVIVRVDVPVAALVLCSNPLKKGQRIP